MRRSKRIVATKSGAREGTLLAIEPLEPRVLLSTTPAWLGGLEDLTGAGRTVTAETRAAEDAVAMRDQNLKISQVLRHVGREIEARVAAGAAGGFADLSVSSVVKVDEAGYLQVCVHLDGVSEAVLADVESAGFRCDLYSPDMQLARGWARYDSLDDIAAVAGVLKVAPPQYAVYRTGSVNSAGDGILHADDVRTRFADFGVDGSGTIVGVLSDGIDHASESQTTDDLPAQLTTDENHLGEGDEGTAMLEIIHDLAPGAALAFYGVSGTQDMVAGINWLTDEANADVIVDDIGFYGQPMFQHGDVADAVAAAVAEGVVYASAAGNDAEQHYQDQWNAGLWGFHDFDPDPGVNDDFLDVWVAPNDTLVAVLQWSDPWGASGNDYNLEIENLLFQQVGVPGTDVQDGNDDPMELAWWTNGDPDDWVNVGLAIWQAGAGVQGRELEVYAYTITDAVPDDDDGIVVTDGDRVQADSIFGHPAVESVISVGAIDADNEPDYDTIQPYSSHGPSTIYTDLGPPQVSEPRDSLDVAGIDGVSTAIGGTPHFDDPFFGTSAAAPHLAAVGALVLDANPALSPAQVASAVNDTAVDLTAYGVGYDDVSGHGRADALGAVYKAFTPDMPDLTTGSDSGVSSEDNVTNDTTPTFAGTVPDGSFVRLYIDGMEEATQQLGVEESTYSITSGPLDEGDHQVTIRVAPDSSTPAGNLSNHSPALTVTIDTIAPRVTAFGLSSTDDDPETGWKLGTIDSVVWTHQGRPARTAPWWRINRLVIDFDEKVVADLHALSLVPPIVPTNLDGEETKILTWDLKSYAQDEDYRVTLTSGTNAVQDIAGNDLDGEPDGDNFPSGDGVPGGDWGFDLDVLRSDAGSDNIVNVYDIVVVMYAWQLPGTADMTANVWGDDYVNLLDVVRIIDNWQAQGAEGGGREGGPELPGGGGETAEESPGGGGGRLDSTTLTIELEATQPYPEEWPAYWYVAVYALVEGTGGPELEQGLASMEVHLCTDDTVGAAEPCGDGYGTVMMDWEDEITYNFCNLDAVVRDYDDDGDEDAQGMGMADLCRYDKTDVGLERTLLGNQWWFLSGESAHLEVDVLPGAARWFDWSNEEDNYYSPFDILIGTGTILGGE